MFEPGNMLRVVRPARPFLGRLKVALTCALLAAATGLAVQATLLLHEATQAARALPLAVSGELRATRDGVLAQVAATRTDLSAQLKVARWDLLDRTEREVAALRRDTMGQVGALRADVMGEVGQIRSTADRRVGDTLARVDTALSTAEGLRSDLRPVEDAAQSTLHDADRTVADLHPQLLGLVAASKVTAGETAQTMRDFRNAFPSFIAQGNSIAANVNVATAQFSGVATNLNRLTKPKWYDRLLGYGLNGVVIYRSLNPATAVTVKAAQLIASRP